MFDPITCYNPEMLAFPMLAQQFAETGTLDPLGFYLILDWKASRARTRHRSRLAVIGGNFSAAVSMIAADLHAATEPEQKLGLLLTRWGFRLPTATAILAVLCPNTFTVYDIRVCNALNDFHELRDMKWSPRAWQEYQRFVIAVRNASPQGLSLRDCDRWLWGENKRETLLKELAEVG